MVPAEPVTPLPPRRGRYPILVQWWRDLTFLHWPVPPGQVAPLLPAGVRPDTLDGVSYVGLIAFRMHRLGPLAGPGLPYLGTFCETNVRLYSVDGQGRRGVVFRSLDAARLVPVLVARAGFRLPYLWARMRLDRDGDTLRYQTSRRWPGPRGTGGVLHARIGAPIADPSPLEHFLTARWGLHVRAYGRTRYLPNEHPAWPLYHADLLHLADTLVASAGLAGLAATAPVSVLYSPGVPVRFGTPI